MSKKIEDSELQTLTLSPTNTNDDESSLFINPASDETTFPVSPPQTFPVPAPTTGTPAGEKRKLERMASVPLSGVKTVPTLRVSTSPGSARISYTNEKSGSKVDFSKISRDRPTPSSSIGQKKVYAPRQSEKSRPSGLVLNIGGKVLPSSKSSLKKADSDGASRHLGKGGSRKLSAANDPLLNPKVRVSASSTVGKGGHFPGQGGAMSAHSNRISPGPKGWLGRAGLRSGPKIREGIDTRQMDRPTQHHTFLTDVADVRQIEQGLLQLMEDFQAGNLRAFGKDSRLRQMEAIREQQERLARLHFDVGAEQDLHPPLSEEGLRTSHNNMSTLMEKLAQLSESIERLHTNTSSDRKTSSNERKSGSHMSRTSDYSNLSNMNTVIGSEGHPLGRSSDPLGLSTPLATSSPQNANASGMFSGNANLRSNAMNSNILQGQQGSNNRQRSSSGYQPPAKNGKASDS